MRFGVLVRSLGWPGILAMAVVAIALGASPAAAQPLAFGPLINVSQTPGGFSRQPHLAIDDANALHLAWADDADGVYRIHYAQSIDGGQTLRFHQVLSSGGGAALRPRLAVHGSNVYVVWMQDPDGAPNDVSKEIMFRRSTNGGQSFLGAPVNLSQTPGNSQEGRIAVSPTTGTIFVVWDEGSGGHHIALRRSFDGGNSFAPDQAPFPVAMIPSTDPSAPTGIKTPYPGIAIDRSSGAVYLVWHDTVGTDLQVRFSRSLDNGAGFSAPLNISHAALHAHCASVNVGPSGRILVAFENRKQVNPHRHDAYFVQSTDGGVSFSEPVNLSRGPSWAFSDYPWAAESPSGLIVVGWEDNTAGGNLQATVAVSTDGGRTFGPLQNVAQTSTTSTEVITAFGPDGRLYVIWEEQAAPNGPAEVLLRTASPSGGPGGLFADVPVWYWARPQIEALARSGITGGCGPSLFCPEAPVKRAEMAVFLVKGLHGVGFTPAPAAGIFADVPPDYWAARWIEQLAADGITGGCAGNFFCPGAPVTRAEMAVFLVKALHGTNFAPGPAAGIFADVPPGYWAAPWIEQLAADGVTGGCAPGVFCPDSPVTRAQMAVFLVNTFNLPL